MPSRTQSFALGKEDIKNKNKDKGKNKEKVGILVLIHQTILLVSQSISLKVSNTFNKFLRADMPTNIGIQFIWISKHTTKTL